MDNKGYIFKGLNLIYKKGKIINEVIVDAKYYPSEKSIEEFREIVFENGNYVNEKYFEMYNDIIQEILPSNKSIKFILLSFIKLFYNLVSSL